MILKYVFVVLGKKQTEITQDLLKNNYRKA